MFQTPDVDIIMYGPGPRAYKLLDPRLRLEQLPAKRNAEMMNTLFGSKMLNDMRNLGRK